MKLSPFLRSPPFPRIAPDVAAISQLDGAGHAVSDELLDRIAGARVGGAFWGQRVQGFAIVVRSGVAVPAAMLEGVGRDATAILPGEGRADFPGRRLSEAVDPWSILTGVRSVHAAPDDEIAIIAGLMGVPVYGPDGEQVEAAILREAARRAVGAAAYRDCFSGRAVDAGDAVAQLADWRRLFDGNQDIAAASGMAFWKREAMGRFLWDGRRSPPFMSVRRGLLRARRSGRRLAVWPSRVPAELGEDAAKLGVRVAKVEDGFLRSKGLGAALTPPGSVVVDHSGIYYDARAASDLETMLATEDFAPVLLERARRLRAAITASGVTKYGPQGGKMLELPEGRRTVLVVGQVEDDLSVRWGGAGVAGNLDLLKRARAVEPSAHIIYRPHPDVQAGLRKGHLSDAAILDHADRIDMGAPLMTLVQAVDEVHVLSSLTGFEALLRDRPVTVHGMPFYAGWGLTRDLAAPNGRRGRKLSIDQLVAAALILYPRYLDPVTRLPCGPETMVERLGSGSSSTKMSWLIRLRMLQGKITKIMTSTVERLHG